LPTPAATDLLLWSDPLGVAVSIDLAIQQRWAEAIRWAVSQGDARATSDSLLAIAEFAGLHSAPPQVFAEIEKAASGIEATEALRVRAAVSAASKDTTKLESCIAEMQLLPALPAVNLPTSAELIQQDVPARTAARSQAIAIGEIARAAAKLGHAEHCTAAQARLAASLAAAAPPTAALRELTTAMTTNEAAYKRRISEEMRVSDESRFAPMFRNYRKHLEQLATAAEDRRLLHLLLLARIVRSGGVSSVQQAINGSAELKQEVLLDELSGVVAVAARSIGQPFPELLTPDVSLRMGRARYGDAEAIVNVMLNLDVAWANRNERLPEGLNALADRSSDNALPGLQLAVLCELVEAQALVTKDPATVLSAIVSLPSQVLGVWREEAQVIASRVFADRGLEKQTDAWIASQKLPALEQIILLYGSALGMLERPVPTPESVADQSSAAESKPVR
jgi:hypothetical protein